ncbi:IclR family transcriptional regulator [Pseudonocardia acaciae]|uniref:IclR family transcriptional regulator n=1 Tax=Pseudonocardia acaciae TaxID=551276 RepID=UPI00048B495D|nr:IclR family transcriptional regulator [Pseudonocardia acaciae]
MRNTPWYPIESADNVLRLLLLLSERRRLRVVDAAEHLGVARSTAHRLLRALSYRDFAVQDAHKAYRPGPAFERLMLPGPSTQDLRVVLHRHLERLHAELGETCHLMVLEGNGARFVDCVECAHVLRIGSRVGMLLPAHVTSGGKALLAELSSEQLTSLYPRDLPASPGGAPIARTALRRQLAAVRRRGYATNLEESERGILAVGACVRDAAGRAVAGLAVAAPSARCPQSRLPELAAVVIKVAEAATADL